jgi:uncharacterized protein YjiS (DUF1127 family)
MSILEEAPASAAAGRGTSASKFNPGAILGRAASAFGAWTNRRMVAGMRDFDDAQLADIGLSRNDVERALMTPISVDPTLHLMMARGDSWRGSRRS